MQITIGICTDDARRIQKTMQNAVTLTVRAKEPLDVMAPNFYLEYNAAYLNYNYCSAFGRYYFMEPATEPGGSMRLQCREDVLMTHAGQILAADAIAARNTSVYNSSFNDPRYTTFQQQAVETKLLFSFPDDDAIILACVE